MNMFLIFMLLLFLQNPLSSLQGLNISNSYKLQTDGSVNVLPLVGIISSQFAQKQEI